MPTDLLIRVTKNQSLNFPVIHYAAVVRAGPERSKAFLLSLCLVWFKYLSLQPRLSTTPGAPGSPPSSASLVWDYRQEPPLPSDALCLQDSSKEVSVLPWRHWHPSVHEGLGCEGPACLEVAAPSTDLEKQSESRQGLLFVLQLPHHFLNKLLIGLTPLPNLNLKEENTPKFYIVFPRVINTGFPASEMMPTNGMFLRRWPSDRFRGPVPQAKRSSLMEMCSQARVYSQLLSSAEETVSFPFTLLSPWPLELVVALVFTSFYPALRTQALSLGVAPLF